MDNSISKFLIAFGTFWLIICATASVPLIISSEAQEITEIALFLIPFSLIGIAFLYIGLNQVQKRKKILANGTHYYGKIVAFNTDSSVRINEKPLLYLEVRYFDKNNTICNVSVSTDSGVAKGYNLGETVHICDYNGKIILAEYRSVNTTIPGEEQLILSYNSRAKSIDQLRPESYYCPHCGANLMIVRGQTVKCPYCDSFVTNTRQFN